MAVKVIDIEHIENIKPSIDSLKMSKEVRSFETEVQLLKNIHHERIVGYFGTERREGKLFIFMEYLAGVSVHACIHAFVCPSFITNDTIAKQNSIWSDKCSEHVCVDLH